MSSPPARSVYAGIVRTRSGGPSRHAPLGSGRGGVGARRRALDHPAADPSLQERDLLVGQPAHADEFSDARLRLPRRHVAALGGGHHLRRVLLDVRVCQQAERRRALRPMTGGAVRQQDGPDVSRERHLRRSCGSGLKRAAHFWRCCRRAGPPPGCRHPQGHQKACRAAISRLQPDRNMLPRIGERLTHPVHNADARMID